QYSLLQISNGPRKYPGVAQGTTTDHYSLATGVRQHPGGILGRPDIPVANNRNFNSIGYLPDDVPVSLTGIKLFSGPAVNSNSLGPGLHHGFGKGHCVDG